MAMTGMAVSDDLKSQFSSVQTDDSVFAVQVDIASSKFVLKETVNTQGDFKTNLEAVAALLDSRMPCYVFFRSPRSQGKFVCMFYCPSAAPVRGRMVYAASVNSVKQGFGSSLLVTDYQASTPAECAAKEYLSTFADYNSEDLMTHDEAERERAEFESAMKAGSAPTKLAAATIPINMDEKVVPALASYQSSEYNFVACKVNVKKETVLHVETGNVEFADLVSHMPPKEGRYIMYRHNYTHEDTKMQKDIFFFYCPDGLKPRSKMVYATVKANVAQTYAAANITNFKTIELNDVADLTAESVYEDLHPKDIKEVKLVKPKARGRGKRSLHSKAKFKART